MLRIESHVEPVILDISTLIGATLDNLCLHRAILIGEDLQNGSFIKTDLRGAELDNANLSSADLSEASLIVAFLKNAILRNAILRNARLIGANFTNANLEQSDLTGADIGGANFKDARLFGAKMLCDRIDSAIFEGAYFDKSTKWPEEFNPINKGAILVDKI